MAIMITELEKIGGRNKGQKGFHSQELGKHYPVEFVPVGPMNRDNGGIEPVVIRIARFATHELDDLIQLSIKPIRTWM